MRRFNPEKELYKIQHGNRNKITLGVLALLIIIVISSSYALYQVRYSKRIIYTKVAPISNKDINLTIFINGEESKNNEFPTKGTGYYFDSIECDNDSQAEFDYSNWSITLNANKNEKCTIKFVTKNMPSFKDYLLSNADLINDETKDKNYRYIGKNPNNYIWFNCDSYDGLTQTTAATKCEKWRIIGVMNNMTIIDETTKDETNSQSLVKIIRADSIGNIAFNNADTNDWTTASLPKSLNTTYYNGTNLGGGKGITNQTQKMIEYIRWNLGGATSGLASGYYIEERGTQTSNSPTQAYLWDGYIGLMYPSDYGYAAGISCGNINLSQYNCYNSNWLYLGTKERSITQAQGSTIDSFYVSPSGTIGATYGNGLGAFAIRPVLYLNSNIIISDVDADGSSSKPYILIPPTL